MPRHLLWTRFLLPAAAAAAETAGWYPKGCCPRTCARVDLDPDQAARLAAGGGSVRVRGEELRISDTAAIRPSPDGEAHACVGYDAFGDREVKCVFAPTPIM